MLCILRTNLIEVKKFIIQLEKIILIYQHLLFCGVKQYVRNVNDLQKNIDSFRKLYSFTFCSKTINVIVSDTAIIQNIIFNESLLNFFRMNTIKVRTFPTAPINAKNIGITSLINSNGVGILDSEEINVYFFF